MATEGLSAYTYSAPAAPWIVAGAGAIDRLPEILETLGADRVVVVTSSSFVREGALLSRIMTLVGERCVGTFERVRPHSPREIVSEALAFARSVRALTVLSVGGGSAIDTAKGVIWYYDEAAVTPPLIHVAVPSTLSGAEYTTDAGITTDGLKQVHRHARLIPHAVVLDPAAAATAPLELLRASLLNALAHCLEGVVSIRRSPMTDAFYLHAIRLLAAASERLRGLQGLADAQAAAALAALHQIPMGLAHALTHVVAGRCRTPHALTHGVMAPAVMRFNLPVAAAQQRHIAEAFGVRVDGQRPAAAAWEAVTAVREFARSLQAPSSLRELGVPEAALDSLAEDARSDSGFVTNPRALNGVADVRQVLGWAWSGEIPTP